MSLSVMEAYTEITNNHRTIWPNIKCGDTEALMALLPQNHKVGEGKNERPRVRGLRRLITEVVGVIVGEETSTQIVGDNGNYVAVVTCRLRVRVLNPNFINGWQADIEASGAADATVENLGSDDFGLFLTACADTRAKGRAYVNLLGLDICTYEEMPKNSVENGGSRSYNNSRGGNTDRGADREATNQDRITINKNLEKLQRDQNVTLDAAKVASHLGFNYDKITESQISQINAKIRKWISGDKIPETLLKG
jgi:hypothetical protein